MAKGNICLLIYYILLLLTAYRTILIVTPKRFLDKPDGYVSKADADLARKIWASHLYEENITCNAPQIHPYHPSIIQFNVEPPPINCEKEYPLLFKSTFDSIVPVKTLEEYEKLGVKDPCCYHIVKRKVAEDDPDNAYTLSEACFPISLVMKTIVRKKVEFIAIRCSINKNLTFEIFKKFKSGKDEKNAEKPTGIVDMHTFIPLKRGVEKRIMDTGANKIIDISSNTIIDKNVDTLNVVILGLDSLSHMNFIRSMPKTYAYLMNHLTAVEMNVYNKIGGNTFPNIVAVLTGLQINYLTVSCETNKAYDNCPTIWKKYSQNGYRTSYGEDATRTGIFNSQLTGFRRAPTDYYLRPFGVAAEDLIGHHGVHSVNQCYGPRLQFNVILDYMKKMAFTMGRNKRYFQFLWSTSLTHDLLNDGKVGDQDLLLTLQWFQNNGYFNNTAFVLMSDHGQGSGKILDSPAGRLEWKMPLLFFVFPPWFRVKYKDAFNNLQTNSVRLTTPYDLHETLNDLINLDGLTSRSIALRQMRLAAVVKENSVPRAISLFLPVPKTRTCSMAGVEDTFCLCHPTTEISVSNWKVMQATRSVINYINQLLKAKAQCVAVVLDSIESAQLSQTDDGNKNVYHVSFDVKPGGGSFYASVIEERSGWKLSGTIGRRNLYGNQSHCVDEKELKVFCYCGDQL